MRLLLIVTVLSLSAAATATSAGAGVITNLTGGNCGSASPVFSAWGDASSYYQPANGGFESGTTGWTVSSGAQVVNEGDPFKLGGSGSHSLKLPAGATASMTVCNGLLYPAVRFVDKGVGGNATLHVRIVAHSLTGVLSILDGGTFTAGTAWAPSPKLSTLMSALSSPLGTKSMEIQLSVTSGTAQIDDLYVDPYRSR
jgi:hypothetical protein